MSGRQLRRIGAATGILHVVLGLMGFFIHGYPEIGASPQQLSAWAASTSLARFQTGVYIEALGFLLLIPFAAWLYSLLRGTDRAAGWVLSTGFGAAVAFVAVTIPINEVWQAMLQGGQRGLDPRVMTAIRDIAQLTFNASFLFLGLFMLATGFLFVQTRLLSAFVGWSAVLIGAVLLVPPVAQTASLLFWLWVLVVSIFLLVRPRVGEHGASSTRAVSSAASTI